MLNMARRQFVEKLLGPGIQAFFPTYVKIVKTHQNSDSRDKISKNHEAIESRIIASRAYFTSLFPREREREIDIPLLAHNYHHDYKHKYVY